MSNKLQKLAISCYLPLLLILHSLSAHAIDTPASSSTDKIFITLSSMENHTGTFVQTKTLTGLSFPIISQGRFAFGKGLGLYNETNKPLFQASSYSSTGVIEWNDQGKPIEKKSKNPSEQYVSEMLLAFFNGDRNHIEEIFQIENGKVQNSDWELKLTPKKKAIQDYILHITIRGQNHIQGISVQSQNGDKTDIHFSNIVNAENLTAYCQYFPETTHTTCQH